MGDELLEPQDDETRLSGKIRARLARLRTAVHYERERVRLARQELAILSDPNSNTDVWAMLTSTDNPLRLPSGTMVRFMAGGAVFEVGTVDNMLRVEADESMTVVLDNTRFGLYLCSKS